MAGVAVLEQRFQAHAQAGGAVVFTSHQSADLGGLLSVLDWSSSAVTEARDIDILHYCRSQTLRHLMLMVRSPSEVINPLLFFLLVIVLFPLA